MTEHSCSIKVVIFKTPEVADEISSGKLCPREIKCVLNHEDIPLFKVIGYVGSVYLHAAISDKSPRLNLWQFFKKGFHET